MTAALWRRTTERGGIPAVTLSLHPGQERAWRSERRFVFMLAGTQGGKTSFGPLWLWREIQRCGPGDYLAVTATFPLLKRKMLPEFRNWFEHTWRLGEWQAMDKVFQFSPDGARRMFGETTDTTTRVIFGSATNSDSLESATAKGAWLDEVGQDTFRLESWEAVLRRLSLSEGRVLGGTTIYNLGWMKQIIFDRWKAHDPDIDVIQFASVENPMFPRAEYERARRSLPAWKFTLFYEGQYSRPAGIIYSDFRDDYREQGGHKVRSFPISPSWPRSVGVDFGAVNTATIWLARDPDADIYYLFHETHGGGKTSGQHAARALATAAGTNVLTYTGGAKSEDQPRMDWGEAGVWIQEPPVSDVEAGIDRVIALFKADRLFVFDSCAGVLDELGTYSREVDEVGETLEKIKNKEMFHRLDALRYVVASLSVPVAAGAGYDREPAYTRPSRRLFGR
jgi:hypothetical protein